MDKARKASHLVKKAKICLCSYSNPYMARNNCEIMFMNSIAIREVLCVFYFLLCLCVCGRHIFLCMCRPGQKQIYSYFNGFITLCFSYRVGQRRKHGGHLFQAVFSSVSFLKKLSSKDRIL